MTYDQARDHDQLGMLEAAIGQFINRYMANPPGPNRQTIILFPGGLGSRLVRADSPYQDGVPGQVSNYDTVWLDCTVLSGAALDLQMQGDIDLDNRFIIADGFVHFALADVKPYDGFIQWCTDRNLDWFRFWLKSEEDPDPTKATQYIRWQELRKLQQENDRKAADDSALTSQKRDH